MNIKVNLKNGETERIFTLSNIYDDNIKKIKDSVERVMNNNNNKFIFFNEGFDQAIIINKDEIKTIEFFI